MDAPLLSHSANFFKTKGRPRKAPAILDLSRRSVARMVRSAIDGGYIDAIVRDVIDGGYGGTLAGGAIAFTAGASNRVRETLELANSIQLALGTLVTLSPSELYPGFDKTLAAILPATIRYFNNECRVTWFAGRTAFLVPHAGDLRIHLLGLNGSRQVPVRKLERWPQATLQQLVAATNRIEVVTFEPASAYRMHEAPNTLLTCSRLAWLQ